MGVYGRRCGSGVSASSAEATAQASGTVPAKARIFQELLSLDSFRWSKTAVLAGVAVKRDSSTHCTDDDDSKSDDDLSVVTSKGSSNSLPCKVTVSANTEVISSLLIPFKRTAPHAKTASKFDHVSCPMLSTWTALMLLLILVPAVIVAVKLSLLLLSSSERPTSNSKIPASPKTIEPTSEVMSLKR
jgi:hypothetical protein